MYEDQVINWRGFIYQVGNHDVNCISNPFSGFV